MVKQAESGNGVKSNSAEDQRSLTVRLGRGEVSYYDYALRELGLKLPDLARTALKLFLWIFKEKKKGAQLKLVYPDGSEKLVTVLELEGTYQDL